MASVFDDIDDSLYIWDYLYKDIVNHHLPTRNVKIRNKSLPWISTYIRKQINLRYKLLKEAKSSQSQGKWELYKSKRNEVKKLLKQSEAAYWQQEFTNSKDPKQFWKLTNKILKKSKDTTIGPITTDSKEILAKDLEKASYFNEFFINISEDLTKNLKPIDRVQSRDHFSIGRHIGVPESVNKVWEMHGAGWSKMVLCLIFGCGSKSGRDKG